MTQKMQMSDFSVNKYKSFVVDSREKKFSVGTFEQRRSGNHKHTYVYIYIYKVKVSLKLGPLCKRSFLSGSPCDAL